MEKQMVYVDNSRNPFGQMIMCHMVADTNSELLTMANRIGVASRWIQKKGTPEEHFDICLSKRKLAVRCGAKEIDRKGLVEIIERKREKCQY